MTTLPYEDVYKSQPDEHAFPVTRVTGAVPADLSGTFLRAGPGRMQLGDAQLNFFDGHAMIAGVSFEKGQATFRSRFVRTPLYEQETAQKTVVQRRLFTNHPSRWSNLFALNLGNSAMHDVYAWGDGEAARVVAGSDPSHFALDPKTLATKGPERWGGAAPDGHEMGPMPYRDHATGNLVGWVKKPGNPMSPDQLKFVELDGAFKVVNETPFYALSAAPAIVHDQRATPNWFVTTEQGARLTASRAIWGQSTIYESFDLQDGLTATLLLAPRKGGGPLVRIKLPAPIVLSFHVINAYEDGDHVIVDLVTYDKRIPFESYAPAPLRDRSGSTERSPDPRPMRFRIDPKAGTLIESRSLTTHFGEPPEVAESVMGRRYRYAYLPIWTASTPERGFFAHYTAIGRIDVESGASNVWESGRLVSPLAFVARPGATEEDDGWVLVWLMGEGGSAIAILDARAMEAGPVATLELGIHLPGICHTRWAGDVQLTG